MLAFDLVVDAFEEFGNRLVIPNLHKLYSHFVLVCSEFVEVLGRLDNDFLNVFETSFWSSIGEYDKVEPGKGLPLASLERRECFHKFVEVSLQTLISRGIALRSETAEIFQFCDSKDVLFGSG